MEHEQEFAINRLRRQLQQLQQHSAATPRSRRNSDADIRREEQLRAALIQEQAVSRRVSICVCVVVPTRFFFFVCFCRTSERGNNQSSSRRSRNRTHQEPDIAGENGPDARGKCRHGTDSFFFFFFFWQTQSFINIYISQQLSAEQQEEFISNKLLRRISDLKREKEQLLLQVEQEEEHMTNTLSKKVSQLVAEKGALELTLQTEREQMISALREQLAKLSNSSDAGTEELVHSIEIMTDQLRQWQQKYLALEKTSTFF